MPLPTKIAADQDWWRHAVVYQIYPRSFADSNDDGVGDINGIRSRLPYLSALGIDAIWINPWYPSPMKDAGYDVSDYRDIEPVFGTMADAKALLAEAHDAGIRVIIDIVPNHTSDQHPWFQEALAAGPGSPQRERFIFREGRGPNGEAPPNDWQSEFGGPAWSRVIEADGPGQWYLRLFTPEQPDLNWDHPDVHEEFTKTLRYWFDLGVDGFRIDVAHGLVKDSELRDKGDLPFPLPADSPADLNHPHWDQPGVHEIFREWRRVADEYAEPKAFCGEIWVGRDDRVAAYLRPDELHTAFNFNFLQCAWLPGSLREVIDSTLSSHAAVGAPPTWVLGNHDVCRPLSRYGRPQELVPAGFPNLHNYQPFELDLELGAKRARAAALLSLALPGGAYIYAGEELGLPEVEDIPMDERQDPIVSGTNGENVGRDGCRVPLPWRSAEPGFGFGKGKPWLPQPANWGEYSVERLEADPNSSLHLYRAALRARHELPALGDGELTWVDAGASVLAFTREPGFGCWVNFGTEPVPLPAGAEVILASQPLIDGQLPTDTTAWLRLG